MVAIHGLNGSRRATWASPEGETNENRVPSECSLKRDFFDPPRSSRILQYGYNGQYVYDLDSLRAEAAKFLDCLAESRADAESVPIVFISHDIGGVIVKEVSTPGRNWLGSTRAC